MFDSMADGQPMGGDLLAIARDPDLRRTVYDRLGEYCHQCRNRLNSLKLSLYLSRRQASGAVAGSWARLEGHYLDLERMVERIQVICRPMPLSKVRIGFDLLIDDRRAEWTRIFADRGGDLSFVPPGEKAIASLDVDRMGPALDALVAWRAQVSSPGTIARVRWRAEAGQAYFNWDEERPRSKFGLGADAGGSRRGDWTIPLLARVLDAHQGNLRVVEWDGWGIELSWPAGS